MPYGVQTSCGLFPTARHLYFSGVFAPPQSSVAAATSILLRSDDLGAHWTRIDDWPGNAFTLVQPPIGDVLTVELATGGASPSGSGPLGPTIEQSANAGASWAQLGNAPGNAHLLPQQPMPNPASSPSSTAPLYAVGGDQIPNSLFRERVYAGDGQTWHLLPPLPVPGATPLRQGITNVLIALPDGRLLASGADPTAGVPQSNTNLPPIQRQWLWVWSPGAGRWSVLADPLPVAWPPACGSPCWHANVIPSADGTTYLAVSNNAFTPAALFITRLPATAKS